VIKGELNTDCEAPAGGANRFCTTHWSVVLLSAQSQEPGSQAALAELCRIYWYPIYAFVRRRGYDADKAQDLTQGFFLHLLDHKTVRQVSPLKGKFRSFLAASLQNYLSDEADRMRRLKRGGNIEFIAIDSQFAECRYRLEASDSLTADKIFDARWAMTLLNEVSTRVATEYAAQGKASTFETLKPFLAPFYGKVSLSYEQAANALGISVGSVKTLIYRLRQRYSALLREEVSRTVSDPREIDEELHALCEAIIATEGQWGP
jgi:RNA polymerase sigma factor (sigma-70 family)